MADLPLVSVIVACRGLDQHTSECIQRCLELDYPRYEVLVLPDSDQATELGQAIVVPTGPVKPSVKRNAGMKKANGEVLAFTDSDAYPDTDWLKNAVACLGSFEHVGAVTGPNLTPPQDTFLQQAGGDILTSYVGLGGFSRRYRITKNEYETKDVMSCNLVIPKAVAEDLGGFDESLLTGEDYKLGLQILATDKKIIYCPNVRVYHHRRPVFLPHLRQMWNYGRDKAILMRAFFSPTKAVYFLPSLLVTWIFGGLGLSFVVPGLGKLYTGSLLLYLGTALVASLCIKNRSRSLHVFCGICATHLVYGLAFIRGMLTQKGSSHASGVRSRP